VFGRRDRVARDCIHANAITVRTAGIERTVCEACGKVSINALEGLSGSASRNQFVRVSERTQ
jgi:hypothetical protein